MNLTGPRSLPLLLAALLIAGCGAGTPRHPSNAPVAAAASQPPAPAATADRLRTGHWTTLPPAPVVPRDGAAVVWTGRELLVWGGGSGAPGDQLHDDGAAYDPLTRTWRVLPPAPLSPRVGQAAAWTGGEMLIWGGYDQVAGDHFHVVGDGAAYDPATDRWRTLPAAPLSARAGAIAVWTGATVIVLGGQPAVATESVPAYGDGAAYDPARNRWEHISAPTPPQGHPLGWRTAVQAGDQLLAWSEWSATRSTGPNSSTSSGGVDLFRYGGNATEWQSVPAAADVLPDVEEVLWTGRFVLVRGMPYNCGACPGPPVPEATDRYDPAANTWTRLPGDPVAGMGAHLVSAWTGQALFSFNPEAMSGNIQPGDTSVLEPAANRWSRLPSAPFGCGGTQSPVWTGREILLYCPHPGSGPVTSTDAGLAYTASP